MISSVKLIIFPKNLRFISERSLKLFNFNLSIASLLIVVVLVRIDCSDKLSRLVLYESIYVFLATWFNYKSNLLLKVYTECVSAISFGKLFNGVTILLRRKCVLVSFPLIRLRESESLVKP